MAFEYNKFVCFKIQRNKFGLIKFHVTQANNSMTSNFRVGPLGICDIHCGLPTGTYSIGRISIGPTYLLILRRVSRFFGKFSRIPSVGSVGTVLFNIFDFYATVQEKPPHPSRVTTQVPKKIKLQALQHFFLGSQILSLLAYVQKIVYTFDLSFDVAIFSLFFVQNLQPFSLPIMLMSTIITSYFFMNDRNFRIRPI